MESKINNAQDVVNSDLNYICDNLIDEFSELSGKRVLIVGGAGFLGYYLVQSILYWNENNSDISAINLVVFDNFMRGIPNWLKELHDVDHIKFEQ